MPKADPPPVAAEADTCLADLKAAGFEIEGAEADAQAVADGDRGVWGEATAGDAQAVGAAEVDEVGALLVGLEHGVFV